MSEKDNLSQKAYQEIKKMILTGELKQRQAISINAMAEPKTEYQRSIVHQVRNTLKYVADQGSKAICSRFKNNISSSIRGSCFGSS